MKTATGGEGWAPEQLLQVLPNGNEAITTEAYSAKELDTRVGEILTRHRELDAWCWVSNSAGESGWVPARTIEDV